MKALLIFILLTFAVNAQGVTYPPPGKYFFVLEFNQPMDVASLKHIENYKVTDSRNNDVPVLAVSVPYETDSITVVDTMVVLLVKAPEYKTTYKVVVSNVKNKNGILISKDANSLTYYFDGYDPYNEKQPYLKK